MMFHAHSEADLKTGPEQVKNQKVSKITNPIKLTIQNTDDYTSKNKEQIIIDKDLVNYPLSLKKWHHGDAMYPTGMTGSKKISQLFKDNKL